MTLGGGDSETVSTDVDTDGFEGEYDYEVTTGDDDSVRFTLIGDPVWTPQIGHVELRHAE